MNDALEDARQALERLIPVVKRLEEENAWMRRQVDYVVSLQRLVEHLCRGNPIPEDLAQAAPYHGAMAKAKQASEGEDTKRLNAYVKMVQEEFPFTPYYSDGCWRYPYLMGNEGGFGGGVAEKTFGSFRLAMDAALQERFA